MEAKIPTYVLAMSQERVREMDEAKVAYGLEATLGDSGRRIGQLILECKQQEKLRTFACECANFALNAWGVTESRLDNALRLVRTCGSSTLDHPELEDARKSVSQEVEELDVVAFKAQAAVEEGTGTEDAYRAAFGVARAVTAVLMCFSVSPIYAAARSCYEAFYSTQNADALMEIGEEVLM